MTQVVLKDRVKETSTTTGTGSMTLDGAVQGFQSFAAIGNGNLTFYTIAREANWEVGIGMYFTSGPTLERNVVLDSSNSGNLVNWGVGEKEVFVTLPSTVADYVPTPNVFEYLTASLAGTGSIGEVSFPLAVEYLVVAGGGGGGNGDAGAANGGGGGAGGFRTAAGLSITPETNYAITVGAGGAGSTNGSNSIFSSITSIGGGHGASNGNAASVGGSGGGGNAGGGATARTGALGTSGEGNSGGTSDTGAASQGSGGGGATTSGSNGGTGPGNGGAGANSSITGSVVTYAGGGGGAYNSGTVPTGGAGGGGNGSRGDLGVNGTPGTDNLGGGGGGGGYTGSQAGFAGGSGVVILKYPDTLTISNPGGGLTFTTSTAVSGYKITTFTAGTGNVQWS